MILADSIQNIAKWLQGGPFMVVAVLTGLTVSCLAIFGRTQMALLRAGGALLGLVMASIPFWLPSIISNAGTHATHINPDGTPQDPTGNFFIPLLLGASQLHYAAGRAHSRAAQFIQWVRKHGRRE